MKKTILIIDDDKKLNELLIDYLKKFSFNVRAATHPVEGLKTISLNLPDLIILDVMLPDMDGFEVCRKIRKDHSVPIIMLTARGDITDRIVGLELGADDYLPKPFEPRELVARIQSVLRRTSEKVKKDILIIGKLKIDYNRHSVKIEGREIELTAMEYEVLTVFVKNYGIVLNRDQIIEKIKGLDWDSFDRSIDVLISRLRQKINDDPKEPTFIKTIWGTGYMFIGE